MILLSHLKDMPIPAVSIIIPTKNEAEGIAKVLKQVKSFGQEILVIDGHSKDNTRKITKQLGVKVLLDQRKGIGFAKRLGIAKAKGEIIVLIDADGSHRPQDIPKLIKPIINQQADLVVASRIKGGSDEFDINFPGIVRQGGGDFIASIINYRFKTKLTDTLNGFRAIRRSTALELDLQANDFDIEHEMIIKCLKRGFKVSEVGSHEYARGWGKAKLPTFSKGWIFIWRLIKEII